MQLSERLGKIKSKGETPETNKLYLWAHEKTIVATRGTKKKDLPNLFRNPTASRDFSCFLDAWEQVLKPILN